MTISLMYQRLDEALLQVRGRRTSSCRVAAGETSLFAPTPPARSPYSSPAYKGILALSRHTPYYFRGEQSVVARMQALPPAQLAVPSIVAYELRYGLMRLPPEAARPRLEALARLLSMLRILDFDDACAQVAAALRAQLEARGTPIGPHDLLIAATALRHGAALVTRNLSEFSRVHGLEVVDWHGGSAA